MFVDTLKQKSRVPAKFIPYLEKYRIYELFHELGRELVMKQPDDHLGFLAHSLIHAAHSCNTKRIIIYAPPFVDLGKITSKIADNFKVKTFNQENVMEIIELYQRNLAEINDKELAKAAKNMLDYSHLDCGTGWMLINFPETQFVAKRFQRKGILPTHVINLVPVFDAPLVDFDSDQLPEEWKTYRKNLHGLRNTFAAKWIDVSLSGRTTSEISNICCKLIGVHQHLKSVRTHRVCLIGLNEFGCKSIAKRIADKFGLVHVHFPLLVKQAYLLDDSGNNEFKLLVEDNNLMESKASRIRSTLLYKKLLEPALVDKGWIVTGFPKTLLDMKRFDKMDTPPNRVIFLDYSEEGCTSYSNSDSLGDARLIKLNQKYPADVPRTPFRNLKPPTNKYAPEIHATEIRRIKTYCGKTASSVDSNLSQQEFLESVSAIMMQALPEAPPRNPYSPIDWNYESHEIPTFHLPCIHHKKDPQKPESRYSASISHDVKLNNSTMGTDRVINNNRNSELLTLNGD